MARNRLMAIFLIIFIALICTATVSATEVNDTTPNTDTKTASQHTQPEKDIQTEQKANNNQEQTTIKNLQKNTKTENKQETTVNDWTELRNAIIRADQDTTIKLQDGKYENTGTISWSYGYVITVDGNGQTINAKERQAFSIYSGCSLILKNIKITNATTTGDGGAIYSRGGTLTVCNSTFTSNNAEGLGGAIYSRGGTLTVCTQPLPATTQKDWEEQYTTGVVL